MLIFFMVLLSSHTRMGMASNATNPNSSTSQTPVGSLDTANTFSGEPFYPKKIKSKKEHISWGGSVHFPPLDLCGQLDCIILLTLFFFFFWFSFFFFLKSFYHPSHAGLELHNKFSKISYHYLNNLQASSPQVNVCKRRRRKNRLSQGQNDWFFIIHEEGKWIFLSLSFEFLNLQGHNHVEQICRNTNCYI